MKTVLIVDDEKDICEIIAINLEDYDLNILQAYSGIEALDYIEKEQVDFVISDIQMPQMNGVDLLNEINKRFKDKDIKHVFMSGFADTNEKQAKEMGSLGLIPKPIDMKFLCDLVVSQLGL